MTLTQEKEGGGGARGGGWIGGGGKNKKKKKQPTTKQTKSKFISSLCCPLEHGQIPNGQPMKENWVLLHINPYQKRSTVKSYISASFSQFLGVLFNRFLSRLLFFCLFLSGGEALWKYMICAPNHYKGQGNYFCHGIIIFIVCLQSWYQRKQLLVLDVFRLVWI